METLSTTDKIEINLYTSTWTARRAAPEIGARVIMPAHPDARELDDFNRVLRAAGRDLDWLRTQDVEGETWDVYAVTTRAVDAE